MPKPAANRPVKGMLTEAGDHPGVGVRGTTKPRDVTARPAGLCHPRRGRRPRAKDKVVQIDGQHPRRTAATSADHKEFLGLGGQAFRLRRRELRDETRSTLFQPLSCGRFNDIIESIAAFDADIISIEASRSPPVDALRPSCSVRVPQ